MKTRKSKPNAAARIRAAQLRNEAFYLVQVVCLAAEHDAYLDSSFAPSTRRNALDSLEAKGLVRRNRRGFYVPTSDGVHAVRRLFYYSPVPLTLKAD